MRVLIVSDIHSNLSALVAVLAEESDFDQIWNLGDTIGYGAHPNECIALLRGRAAISLAGNHDLGCIGILDLAEFNQAARTANLWNGAQLEPSNRAWIEMLAPIHAIDSQYLLAHGSPRTPIWEYLLTVEQATANFEVFDEQVCLIGHSHIPLIFRQQPSGEVIGPIIPNVGETLMLSPTARYLINPGSVGQPRNHDPRAAYAILDTEAATIRFERITYDISSAQRAMLAAGLPEMLATRLQFGY